MDSNDAYQVALSERAQARLDDLRYRGQFDEQEAEAKACRLVQAAHGADQAGDHIELFWLVDEQGFIRDVRFQTPATGLICLAFELMAELCVGITVEQASRISPAHVIERLQLVYDQADVPLPWSSAGPFPVLLKIARQAGGDEEVEEQVDEDKQLVAPGEWDELGLFDRVRKVEQVLDEQIRPMLAADGGGVDLVDLREGEIIVSYQGACGSCSSAIGGTLQFMTDTLNQALSTQLRITVQGLEYEPFVDL